MPIPSGRLLSLLLVGLLVITGRADEPSPGDRVTQLVPDDAQFCLILRNFRDDWAALERTGFPERFAQTELGKKLFESPEWSDFRSMMDVLRTKLDLTPEQFWGSVVGDGCVLAFREGESGGEFLLATWVRLPDGGGGLARKVTETPEVTSVVEQTHNGTRYLKIRKADETNDFIYAVGPLFVASNSQPLIQEVINQNTTEVKTSLALRRLRELGIDQRSVVWWLNPRPFDRRLEQEQEAATGAEQAFLAEFRPYWSALDTLALSLDVGDQFDLGLSLKLREEDLPERGRGILETFARQSDLWDVIPENASLAIAAHVDLASLFPLIEGFLSPGRRVELRTHLDRSLRPLVGRDALTRLLDGLGPDVGFWINPPALDGTEFPNMTAAVRLRGDRKQALAESLRSGVTLLGIGSSLELSNQHPDRPRARLGTRDINGVRVTYLDAEGHLPKGLTPSFGVRDDWLVFATRPELVAEWKPPSPRDAVPRRNPLLRCRTVPLAALIRSQQETLGGASVTPLVELLELFDALEVTSDYRSGRLLLNAQFTHRRSPR